ncbi:MAG: L,D-transpeptidase family protein [bacterium]|nr:L,D-transpeptidase family protein [bacterium]
MSRKKIGLISLFSFTAVLSLVAALGAITSLNFEGRVLPRTMVAGVDIGGLPYSTATEKIQLKASEMSALQLTFSLDDKSASASLDELGVQVDEQSTLLQAVRSPNSFDWLAPTYWRSMFSVKKLDLSYGADPSVLRQKVETLLGVTTAAKDAVISYDNGQLVVSEGQKGISISDIAIDAAIKTALSSGTAASAKLEYTESSPIITTEIAAQTKTDVEQKFIPIYLKFEDKNFTITPSSQYSILDFSPMNGKIGYQVSQTKVSNYLSSAVASKVNIKMLPKTTQSDTQQVTQEGRDGRETDLTRLAKDVTRTITELTDTSSSPIAISTRTIPFTEKIVYPDYEASLFPGLYIYINLAKQRLFIMNGGTKQAEYVISSGKRGTPTPSGTFYIKNKIPLAQSRLFPGIWMEKWNALARTPDGGGYQGYGLHRVPCFDPQCNSREPASHLGRPVSHGCVRISNEGADWVYDNAPIGTPVVIR